MKTKLPTLKLLVILCSAFATTAVFSQTTYTWTGAADGTNLATAGNWTANGVDPATTLPSGATQDTAQWDGVTASNLVISCGSVGLPGTGFGSLGINLVLTPNQNNSVQLVSSIAASAVVAINAITNNSAAAAFILGDGSANALTISARPAGAVHYFVNNSTIPVTINPSVRWQAGGAVPYTLDFGGSGDWTVNHHLRNSEATTSVQKSGSGTMTWTEAGASASVPVGPVTINGGTLLINGTNTAASTTVNGGTLGGTGTLSGPVTLNAGTMLAPGVNSPRIGTLTIDSDLTLGGNLAIDLERNASPSVDLVVVTGVLTNTGTGSVLITFLGSFFLPPVGGDKFTLFSKPLQNGGALAVNSVWVNNLAVDGSISVRSTVYTWTGATDRTNLSTAGNWSPVGSPASSLADIVQWDGLTTSNLVISDALLGLPNGPPYQPGLRLLLTSNQTNSVQIISPVSVSPSLQIFGVTNNSPHSPFILGDDTANNIQVIARPPGAEHPFMNNSTAACIIGPSVKWLAGGGNGYTCDFSGPGNWIVNNYLMPDNGATPSAVQVDGPGLVFWSAGKMGSYAPNSRLTNITVNGGGLILRTSFPFNDNLTRFSTAAIAISTFLTYDPTNGTDAQALNGVISGSGQLIVNGGTLMLGGNNTYGGGTVISNGVLQVGTNGPSGSAGTGNVTNNGVLVFNRADTVAFGNVISGTGSVVQNGSGTLTLNGANTYTGSTTVSNGTLVVNSIGGDLNVSGGSLVPVGVGSVGTLNVAGNLNISSGTVLASLNKSLSPSNSFVSVAGTINNSGGALKLLNFGPNFVVGDKFILFNRAVSGSPVTTVSPGFTVANNLALDGSVTVTSVASSPATVKPTISGGQLTLTWPAAWTGLHLQVQTNPLTIGLSTNWVTIPGSDAGHGYITTVNPNASVFYRLAP